MVERSVASSPPVSRRNFHGKEGVDGSSPSEGFDEVPVSEQIDELFARLRDVPPNER